MESKNNYFIVQSSACTAYLPPIVVLAILTFFTYSNSLNGTFFLDDLYHLVRHPKTAADSLKSLLTNPLLPGREVTDLTFALNHYFHKTEVVGYHLVNLILHFLNASLIYFFVFIAAGLLTQPLQSAHGPAANRRSYYVAIFISLVFAVHPLFSAAVNYSVQRYLLMATAFYLMALIAYIKARSPETPKKWPWWTATVIFAWLALHSKEIAVTIFLAILLIEGLWLQQNGRQLKTKIRLFIALIALFLVYGGVSLYLIGWFQSAGARLWGPWQQFQAESIAFFHYWKMLVLPLDQWMNIDHDFSMSTSAISLSGLLALGFHFLMLGAAVVLVRKGRMLAGMGIGWFYITLLPYWIVPEADLLVNYKAYLPGIGLMLILTDISDWLITRRKFPPVVLSVVAILVISFMAVSTYGRNKVYQNDLRLWMDTAKKSPQKARVFNNRGYAYFKKDMLNPALQDYNRAIALNPSFARAYENRGCLYFEQKNYSAAKADFQKAIDLNTENARVFTNLGSAYRELKMPEMAVRSFDQALSLDSKYAEAYFNRGLARLDLEMAFEALMDFDEAVHINPLHAEAFKKRGDTAYALNLPGVCEDFKAACRLGNCLSYNLARQQGLCK